MNESQRNQCPKCGAKWRSGSTICELCGFEEMRPTTVGLYFICLATVAPMTFLGYCILGYPLAKFSSEIFAWPWLWVGFALLVSYGLYLLVRPRKS